MSSNTGVFLCTSVEDVDQFVSVYNELFDYLTDHQWIRCANCSLSEGLAEGVRRNGWPSATAKDVARTASVIESRIPGSIHKKPKDPRKQEERQRIDACLPSAKAAKAAKKQAAIEQTVANMASAGLIADN